MFHFVWNKMLEFRTFRTICNHDVYVKNFTCNFNVLFDMPLNLKVQLLDEKMKHKCIWS
jgi:hypothetical protein